MLNWLDIAGERLAAVSEPEKLQWPVSAKNAATGAAADPASLIVKVEGAFAIDVQHLAPLLIERINARLGWRCVGRILIRQGPVRRRAPARGIIPPPSAEAQRKAAELTRDIETSALREALARLGARALGAAGAGCGAADGSWTRRTEK